MIKNRVVSSNLMSLDLEQYYHSGERLTFDLAQCLYEGLMLREKDFRGFVKNFDWTIFKDKNVAIYCSADAIVPTWAYMVLTCHIGEFANKTIVGTAEMLEMALFDEAFAKIDWQEFQNQKVVIKGCSDFDVPTYAYGQVCQKLQKVAKLIMYGEPCSYVPVYKTKIKLD